MRLNRTLFEAGFTRLDGESEEEFVARIERHWRLASSAMGVFPIYEADEEDE